MGEGWDATSLMNLADGTTLLACCMKTLLRCLTLLALPLLSVAQSKPHFIDADSLTETVFLYDNWRYHDGDSSVWSSPNYDDSHWPVIRSGVASYGKEKQPFSGTAWFRQRLVFDTSIVGKPVALSMSHLGASEVYLNGKLLKRNGIIGTDSAESYDPNHLPFVWVPPASGEHVLAIRYADPHAAKGWNKDGSVRSIAFGLRLAEANGAIYDNNEKSVWLSVILISLLSIFGTIAVLHFIIYLYQPLVRSNGLFALFAFCLALTFLIGFLATQGNDYTIKKTASAAMPYVVILSCISLSGFINALFGKRKWRFRVLAGLGIISAVLLPFEKELSKICAAILSLLVLLEVTILVISAMRRKVPGARIIAAGVLTFPTIMLGLLLAGLALGGSDGNINLNGGWLIGALLIVAVLAIPISMSAYLAWSFAAVNKRLKAELLQVETLSEKTRLQEEEKQRFLESRKEELEREVAQRTEQLRGEKRKSDELLLNILPEEVAEELKEKGYAQARLHDDVTVLFTDFVDFTRHSEQLTPAEIVDELDGCFKAFDEIITRHGLEKIKTIGDAYMAVAGLPVPHVNGAAASVAAALEIREYIRQRRAERPGSFDIRIGVHSGPVVAGIIGVKKFAYDIWGDTVNTAARMEQSSEPGKVNISGATYALVKDQFVCAYRGVVAAKGKGALEMYFVEKEISRIPNAVV
jgi:class 3 adenylate cyclase